MTLETKERRGIMTIMKIRCKQISSVALDNTYEMSKLP